MQLSTERDSILVEYEEMKGSYEELNQRYEEMFTKSGSGSFPPQPEPFINPSNNVVRGEHLNSIYV